MSVRVTLIVWATRSELFTDDASNLVIVQLQIPLPLSPSPFLLDASSAVSALPENA
jgi:hypothetical protein